MSPAVSILVPVYNREKLLQPCVESALNQTRSDLEIVICDNCSTDGTWLVCEKLAAADARVRIMRNEQNLGPVRNWARCIAEARAPLAKLLFSDDLLEPTYLEATAPMLDDPRVALAFTSIRYLHDDGSPNDIAHHWPAEPGNWSSQDYLRRALTLTEVPVSPGAALFRTADLRRNLMLEIPSPTIQDFAATGAGPDLLLYLLTAARYPLVGYVPTPLAIFRAHAGSITISMPQRVQLQYLHACVWFTGTYGTESEFRALLRRAWWAQCEAQGRLIDFADFTAGFSRPFRVNAADRIFIAKRGIRFWRRRFKRMLVGKK